MYSRIVLKCTCPAFQASSSQCVFAASYAQDTTAVISGSSRNVVVRFFVSLYTTLLLVKYQPTTGQNYSILL